MGADDPTTRERRVTTDTAEIESWAQRHDRIPVREGDHVSFVPEEQFDSDRQERLDWNDLEEFLERTDHVVAYRGEDYAGDEIELVPREEAVSRFEDEDVEERLLAGETVTGTVRETAVVERTIVEEAEIESEVVDREIVDRTVVDAELLTRECVDCTPRTAGGGDHLGRYGDAYFLGETGAGDELGGDDPLTFDLEVEESWTVTIEELERFTVESRVTDVDVAESDAVEGVDLEADVDVERVQDRLLESDLFEVDYSRLDEVDSDVHAIETEMGEGDTLRTDLTRRRTVDREVAMTHDVAATATESERTRVETAHEEVVEAGLAEREHEALGGTGAPASADVETRTTPSEDDEGKPVVDGTGEELGIVSTVEDGLAYVDPHPSITEKVMARLGWGDVDDEDYSVGPESIVRITDDEVEVVARE